MKSKPVPPPVVYPQRGTPPDADGYPHYATLEAANKKYRMAYDRLQAQRRRERQHILEKGSRTEWVRRVRNVRHAFAKCLGLELTRTSPKLEVQCSLTLALSEARLPNPELKHKLSSRRYVLNGVAWDGGPLELLVLYPRGIPGPKPGVLLIPDSGAALNGAQSPESATRGLGWKLARAGFIVAIPKLPALEKFSTTENKRRLLEGSCTLGALLGEAARGLDWLLKQDFILSNQLCVAGTGLGGLAALMLGALDQRVTGVLAVAPLRWGTPDDHIPLVVPHSHPITDLEELCASVAPRPLALLAPETQLEEYDAVPANVARLQKAAQPAYARARARGQLKTFLRTATQQAVDWLREQMKSLKARPGPELVVRAKRPYRSYAVTKYSKPGAWMKAAKKLRHDYRKKMNIPYSSPRLVRKVSEKSLPNYKREEFHIRTGEHSWANVTFLAPHSSPAPRPTILYLPGSGSDVAKVETEFAHEVVAEGWNACIMDARVALYPFHPGIAEGSAIIAQSVHDLLCSLDYVIERKDVDARCIGAMGLSQGGTHSWMTAAMDDRIAAAVTVCGLSTYRASIDLLMTERYGGSYQSFLDSGMIYYCTPGVLELADQQELCALIAPRPFMFIGADKDYCFSLDGMRECARDVAHIYRVMNAEGNFEYLEFDGGHSMPESVRRPAYAFFRRHFERLTKFKS